MAAHSVSNARLAGEDERKAKAIRMAGVPPPSVINALAIARAASTCCTSL